MKKFMIIALLMISCLIMSCATTPNQRPFPDEIFTMYPEKICDDETHGSVWDLRARIHKSGEINYLVFYFDSGFNLSREPEVRMKTGMAVFEGSKGNVYVYKVGAIPKTRQIAEILFPTPVPKRIGTGSRNQIILLSLEQRENEDCLRTIEVK